MPTPDRDRYSGRVRSIVRWISVAVAAAGAWLLMPRSAPPSPGTESGAATPPANASATARGAGSTADAVAPARDDVRTPIADPWPCLDDFAPEQRAAVREILAQSQPEAAQVAAVRAAIAKLAEDDTERRAILERELLDSAAIVRCDVLAVGLRTVTVRCRSRAGGVGAEVGARRIFGLGVTSAQEEILVRHRLPLDAALERGRTQALLIGRIRLLGLANDVCVLAGPPRGAAVVDEEPPAQPLAAAVEQQLLDFEPAVRPVVRELLTDCSSIVGPVGVRAAGVLVRCKVERAWGSRRYRSLVDLPDAGIRVGERIEAFDHLLPEVRRQYGLLDAGPLQPGEVRTLVVYSVEPFGFGLYKRWVLLASPPLPQ
jgi:hypothetical protein